MIRTHVGVELLWLILRHKNYDAINRTELRRYMAAKFPEPGSSPASKSKVSAGNRATRQLNAALRQLEREGVLRRRESPNGAYVDLLNVGKAEAMLRKLVPRFTHDKPTSHRQDKQ